MLVQAREMPPMISSMNMSGSREAVLPVERHEPATLLELQAEPPRRNVDLEVVLGGDRPDALFVPSPISGLSLSARETVDFETPARRAMSAIVWMCASSLQPVAL